jgi:hypothetical protein
MAAAMESPREAAAERVNRVLDGRSCFPVASAGGTFFVNGRRLAWSGRSAASPAAREAFGTTGVLS